MAGSADHAQAVGVYSRVTGSRPLVSWVSWVVVLCFIYLVAVWAARPWTAGDTPFVLDGTNALIDCLSRRDFVACRFSGELDYWGLMSPIGDWPLLQHVPDLISVGLGVDAHNDRERVLVLLSVAGIVGSVILARLVLSRVGQAPWFWGFLLVVLSGPLIFYAGTTLGEALATGLLVCLVAATVLRAPPAVIALAALAACLTKETAYPFVAVLGLLGLVLASRRTGLPIRRHVVWGTVGMTVGIAFASLFNIVRFGSVLNTNYLQSELHTPGISRKLDYALALFVSPNGGVFVFWPAASILLLMACLLPLSRSGRQLDARPALVIVIVVLGVTLGLASWWDPFGTFYGPRLTLPWLLPLVLIALVAYGRPLGELVGRLLAPLWRLVVVFTVVLAFALPHVGHMWRPEATGRVSQNTTPPCEAPWRGGVAEWHSCHHEEVWRLGPRPLLVDALEGVRVKGGALTSVVVAAALLGCLILLREELRVPRRARL